MAAECRGMHIDRERGEGSGEGESMRDLGTGWVVKRQIETGVVV